MIYGSLALALAIVYRASGVMNVAIPQFATLAAFLFLDGLSLGLPYGVALAAAAAVISAASIGLYLLTLAVPKVDSGEARVFVLLFAAFFFLHGVTVTGWGSEIRQSPGLFDSSTWSVAGVSIRTQDVGIMLASALGLVLLSVLFNRTKFGLALRASVSNREASRTHGIPVVRMAAAGWAIAGVIVAVAGVMAAPVLVVTPDMTISMLVYVFAAWIVGGLDSGPGAFVAGILIGVGENLMGFYVIGTDLKLPVMLLILVGVLRIRPQGLWGSKQVVRV